MGKRYQQPYTYGVTLIKSFYLLCISVSLGLRKMRPIDGEMGGVEAAYHIRVLKNCWENLCDSSLY